MTDPRGREILITPSVRRWVGKDGRMGRRLSTIHSRQRCASQLRRLIARRAASRSDSIKLITLTVTAVFERRIQCNIVGGHTPPLPHKYRAVRTEQVASGTDAVEL